LLYPNKTGWLLRTLFPQCKWKVQTEHKEIFLTFDDGPMPGVTDWVLNILKENQIKGTFFCVGDNIRKNPDLFKEIVKEGHAVGNHTYHHLKGWQTQNEAYYANVDNCALEMTKLGIMPQGKPLFRPPYGQIKPSQANYLKDKFQLIMWSIVTGDFDKTLNQASCLQKAVKMTVPGTIIVFHDSFKAENNLRYLLPRYIERMTQLGYIFSPLR
jgi:peptidoglycan/xylan/chitin deacetylase (PgdA/CDA1 family)